MLGHLDQTWFLVRLLDHENLRLPRNSCLLVLPQSHCKLRVRVGLNPLIYAPLNPAQGPRKRTADQQCDGKGLRQQVDQQNPLCPYSLVCLEGHRLHGPGARWTVPGEAEKGPDLSWRSQPATNPCWTTGTPWPLPVMCGRFNNIAT